MMILSSHFSIVLVAGHSVQMVSLRSPQILISRLHPSFMSHPLQGTCFSGNRTTLTAPRGANRTVVDDKSYITENENDRRTFECQVTFVGPVGNDETGLQEGEMQLVGWRTQRIAQFRDELMQAASPG